MSRIIKKYSLFLESQSDEALFMANEKVRKAIRWISVNQSTYYEWLLLLDIYASYDLNPKTMATNGSSIAFHPDFVNAQGDEAVRFVLCHEVLHCLLGHHERRYDTKRAVYRNPRGWNIACDYALNPLLCRENGIPVDGFAWPLIDGERSGLYRADFDSLTAEEIYEKLVEEGSGKGRGLGSDGAPKSGQGGSFDDVKDADSEMPDPSGEPLQVASGESDGEGEGGEEENADSSRKKDKGKSGSDGSKKSEGEEKTNRSATVGDKVRLKNGSEAVVKKVFPDGSIEI